MEQGLIFIHVAVLTVLSIASLRLTVISVEAGTFKRSLWLKLIAYFCLIILWIVSMNEIVLRALMINN